MYGATRKTGRCIAWGQGLSPCVRGYHRPAVRPPWCPGSIPVCTGLPTAPPSARWWRRVYPRVYGATDMSCKALFIQQGLSPCVRGYQAHADRSMIVQGSIPVCTGLPERGGRDPEKHGVYPRVYGATVESGWKPDGMLGLSPCVRGYRHPRGRRRHPQGSIPVCTGLPIGPRRRPTKKRVYPRVYGATDVYGRQVVDTMGLSPCVRGYPAWTRWRVVRVGSIPVCTGLPPDGRRRSRS